MGADSRVISNPLGGERAANNWSTRTFTGVYGSLLTGVVVCAFMGFLAYAFLRWSRPIEAAGPAGERERRFRKMVGSILVATQYLLALQFTWIGLTPLSNPQACPPGIVPFLVIALDFVVVVVVLVMRYGQGGTRLAGAASLCRGRRSAGRRPHARQVLEAGVVLRQSGRPGGVR